jgi:hypothetical protein
MNLNPNFPAESTYRWIDLGFFQASRVYLVLPMLLFYRNALLSGELARGWIGFGLWLCSKCDFNRSLGGVTASFGGFMALQGRNRLHKALNPAWGKPLLLGTR